MLSRRRTKLVNSRMQLSWVAFSLLASGFCLVVQAMILVLTMGDLAQKLPEDGNALLAALPSTLAASMGMSFLILAPFLAYVGVLLSFRIFGPVHRMQAHLKAVLAGEATGNCRLRKGDEFHELCDLINKVVDQRAALEPTATREKSAA